MAKLRVGTIGLRAGNPRVWQGSALVETTAICDVDENTLKAAAEVCPDALATTDWKQVVNCPEVDIVFVAAPDQFHAEMTVAAVEAGKHVLCEKPMGMTVEECEQMVNAADKAGVKLMVGQVCRFAPGFVMAKKFIDQGIIGDLFFVESEYAHDYAHIPGVGGWRKDPVRLRHPILGGGCHAVDLVRWIAGNVEEVFAYSNKKMLRDWPVDDCTIATLKFAENEVIGKVLCSVGCKRPYTMRSVFWGSEGTIVCDNTSTEIQVASEKLAGQRSWCQIPVQLGSHNKCAEIDGLARAITEGKPADPDGREGARTVATCLAAVASAASGQPEPVRNEF